MAHFAEIKNNKVVRVIVVDNNDLKGYTEPLTIEQAKEIPILKVLGGDWVQTSFNGSFRGSYAGIGDTWNGIEFVKIDYTPPPMSGNLVAIPPQFEWVFRNDRFEINGFVVEFIRTPDDVLAVDIAYLQWEAFRYELDKPENITVKNSLEPIWDYVLEQINNGNFI